MALLGIDLGTSSVKVLVADGQGRMLGIANAGYPVSSARAGEAEGDPEDWWTATCAAAREALTMANHPPIDALGLSGQMHGFVLVNEGGAVLRPAMLWADGRADRQAARFGALPRAMRTRLANPALPGMAGPMLAWLAEHEPDTIGRARWALQPKDWLRFRMTGLAATDPSDASATLLFDIPADGWATDVAEAMGVPSRLLPPLLASTAVAGDLVGDPFGIGRVPVIVGAADTAAAAVGTGLLAPGMAQLSVGTGAQAIVLSDTPAPDATFRTNCFRAATATGWYTMAAVQNAGLALDWVRRTLAADWQTLYDCALDGPRPDGPLFIPFLTHERAHQPHGQQPARFADLRFDHGREDLLRAALEGVACGVRAAMDALPELAAGAAVRLTGGGSLHPGWTQLLADILDRPLVAADVAGASARGAALLAGVGVGMWESVEATGALAPPMGATISPRPERRQDARILVERYRRAWSGDDLP